MKNKNISNESKDSDKTNKITMNQDVKNLKKMII